MSTARHVRRHNDDDEEEEELYKEKFAFDSTVYIKVRAESDGVYYSDDEIHKKYNAVRSWGITFPQPTH